MDCEYSDKRMEKLGQFSPYDKQQELFTKAIEAGWQGKHPGALGTFPTSQALEDAQQFLEHKKLEDSTCA